ncbi:MAG: hypothetical protein LOD90_08255, partial [Symbiobacteriaceae bacterium]
MKPTILLPRGPRRHFLPVALLLTGLLLLAACGKGASPAAESGSAEPAQEAAANPTEPSAPAETSSGEQAVEGEAAGSGEDGEAAPVPQRIAALSTNVAEIALQ